LESFKIGGKTIDPITLAPQVKKTTLKFKMARALGLTDDPITSAHKYTLDVLDPIEPNKIPDDFAIKYFKKSGAGKDEFTLFTRKTQPSGRWAWQGGDKKFVTAFDLDYKGTVELILKLKVLVH